LIEPIKIDTLQKMKGKPKIIIVDDHCLFREGIKLLIEMEGIGKVIAEAENGLAFINLLEKHDPDLVLMDIEMPVMGGLETTIKALSKKPDLKIIVLTMSGTHSTYSEMIRAGVKGVILKTSGKQEFEEAIKTVIKGETYFSNKLLRNIIKDIYNEHSSSLQSKKLDITLTDREKEVLEGFCEGLTASEISEKLFRSVKTIEAHRSKLLQKSGTKNTLNLVLFAIRNKLVQLK